MLHRIVLVSLLFSFFATATTTAAGAAYIAAASKSTSSVPTLSALYGDHNPYTGLSKREVDTHGWGQNASLYERLVKRLQPSVVVEVGVWKGGTTCAFAKALRRHTPLQSSVIVAVDTWLGAPEFWTKRLGGRAMNFQERSERDLQLVNGYPTVFYTFLSNVLSLGLESHVIPFPVPSEVASNVFKTLNWNMIDLIHIDGSHDYMAVLTDLRMWWPLVRGGGVVVCDDYGVWPGVTRAVDEFARREKVHMESMKWSAGGKAMITKPLHRTRGPVERVRR